MDQHEIVVIDDEETIRENLKDLLEMEGYKVLAFKNGKEAISGMTGKPRPCLILLDLMMPIMDGFEFMKKREKIGNNILQSPVILVSAIVCKNKVKETGASGFIEKPIDMDELLKLTNENCGSCVNH